MLAKDPKNKMEGDVSEKKLRMKGSHFYLSKSSKVSNMVKPHDYFSSFKDGAYYCHCAYVLRISRYSSFLSVMLTNTGIFLRGLKLSG